MSDSAALDLHYWPTPNGHKVTLLLEELAVPYTLRPVNITAGEQFKPDYLAISPNNKMPALVDHEAGLSVFESGAILRYLADKYGRFGGGGDLAARARVDEWLFWQVGGLGPMSGQLFHFLRFAPEPVPYAIDRFRTEVERLHKVLDKRLGDSEFLAGDYSIADMASYPWLKPFAEQLPVGDHVRRWLDTIAARPATASAYARAEGLS